MRCLMLFCKCHDAGKLAIITWCQKRDITDKFLELSYMTFIARISVILIL